MTWIRLHDPAEPMGALAPISAQALRHRPLPVSSFVLDHRQLLLSPGPVRGRGGAPSRLARALIAAVEAEARAAGASRIYWLTQENNAHARALYDQLAERSGFIQYRKVSERLTWHDHRRDCAGRFHPPALPRGRALGLRPPLA